MNILQLASRIPLTVGLLAFIVVFILKSKREELNTQSKIKNFLDYEVLANSTRRKPLDSLPYIIIPYDSLPMDTATDDEIVAQCISDMEKLREQKIVNFTGKTNTDLKFEYGAPNINTLMEFDTNFTTLSCTLALWCQRLNELGYKPEALQVCEFAVRVRCDVSAIFYLCGDLYMETNQADKIPWLKQTAASLNSAIKPVLVKNLNSRYPDFAQLDGNFSS